VAAAARKVLAKWPQLADAIELRENTGTNAASAVLTSSGTMSLHCALAGIPGAVVYKTKTLTYWLGRMLVSVEHIGMANLLLKEPMYPEFIQGAATAKALAKQLRECTGDLARRERTQAQAAKLRALLSRPAAGTAADWLARRLG
jgi:lipid-A-disaccharide synthase